MKRRYNESRLVFEARKNKRKANEMKIKDTKDIIYDDYKIHHTKLGKGIRPKEHDSKKWVAVDDLIRYIKNNNFSRNDLKNELELKLKNQKEGDRRHKK